MGRVRAHALVPGPVPDVEALWYDRNRWPAFVEGFATVAKADPQWPQEGATLIWDSTPHGRGRVLERVVAYEPLGGQALDVEDERLRGRQEISFRADGTAVQVELTLSYELKQRNPLTPLIDLLFVRRALGDSLRRTLERFARERRADVELST